MAKQFEVNREQYKKARKMDHNQFIDYVRGVYEKGRAAGQQIILIQSWLSRAYLRSKASARKN